MKQAMKHAIDDGNCVLGIEFGSTRIKAVLLDETNSIVASGSYQWENQYKDGVWTYPENEIWQGLQSCYRDCKETVRETYGTSITMLKGIGISGMMHGYIALDEHDKWLVPFRTWRNTITAEASKTLSKTFEFHIPQRWTIAHLYQSILNKETHINHLSHVTTLAGYIHYKLTGKKVVGIGEASGIFPINTASQTYDKDMISTFHSLTNALPKDLLSILPEVHIAGDQSGTLTADGALLLDPTGELKSGSLFAPPEGDAGTGMVATNAIEPRTGNVSAGTSVFAMIVLEKPLSKPYDTIDVVTTPDGSDVAMVHVNNCTSDINAWASLFQDVLSTFGHEVDTNTLYETLFQSALKGSRDVGKLLTNNYFSGEHITEFESGRPLLVRTSDSSFTLANVMKANLFSSLATLRLGMDVLLDEEQVPLDSITGHGGLFKTPYVGQVILASAINTPITTLDSAAEGGPYGMAILTQYMIHGKQKSLSQYLNEEVFNNTIKNTVQPQQELVEDFNDYLQTYKNGLAIERAAIKHFNK